MREHVFVSVVIYTYNDEKTIADALLKIDSIMFNSYEVYEIILVNDCSSDRTLTFARDAIEKIIGNITIINLSRRHGIEHAMLAGLNKSMGDFIYEIESTVIDFDNDLLLQLYKKATTGYDIVSASSNKTSINSKLFYAFINKMSYLDLDLSTENIRFSSRRALNAMLNLKEKVRYRKALFAFTGFSKTKIEYEPNLNMKIQNKKFNKENISLALDVIVSFSNIGLKIAHYLSFIFFAFSISMIFYSIYNYLLNKNIVEGWTTLMIVVSTGFAGLFFIIGMLGEYISRMLIEIQNRPFYSTRSVEIFKEKETGYQRAFQEVAITKADGENGV